MENQTLEKLLDRYFAGDTTLEEEQQLREHFRSATLPPAWQPYQAYFALLDAAKAERVPLRLRQLPPLAPRRSKWRYLAAAAVVAVLAASWWQWILPAITSSPPSIKQQAATIDWSKYEPQTPKEAYQITRKALRQVAADLDRGSSLVIEPLEKMGEMGKLIR